MSFTVSPAQGAEPPAGPHDPLCAEHYAELVADPSLRISASARKQTKAVGPVAAALGHGALLGGLAGSAIYIAKEEGGAGPADEKHGEKPNERERVRKDPLADASRKATAEQPPRSPPSRAELIKRAQEALGAWDKTKQHGLAFGKFLLESELRDDANAGTGNLDDTTAEQEAMQAAVLAAARGADGFQRALGVLRGYSKRYCRDLARLSDYFGAGCGNCEAASKLFVAALVDGRIPVPPGYELGLQKFSDHIQAVLLNRSSGEVFTLLDGSSTYKPQAPIYRPELLLHGYLLGHGAKSPVTGKDLLLLDVDVPPGAGLALSTNSQLDFGVKSGAAFATGEPPAFATISALGSAAGALGQRETNRPGAGGRENAEQSEKWRLEELNKLKNQGRLPTAAEREEYRGMLDARGLIYVPMDTLLFRDEALLARWQAVKDVGEAERFMRALNDEGQQNLLTGPGIRRLRGLVNDPSRFAELDEKGVYEIHDALDLVRSMGQSRGMQFASDEPTYQGLPAFHELKKDFDRLARLFNKEPAKWLERLDTLPPAAFRSFMHTMHYDFGAMGLKDLLSGMRDLVAEGKIDLFRPLTAAGVENYDTLIDFDFTGSPRGTFYTKGDPQLTPKPGSGGRKDEETRDATRPRASLFVRPQTMAGLLLSAFAQRSAEKGLKPVGELWSSSLTTAVAKHFDNQEHDSVMTGLIANTDALRRAWLDPAARRRYGDFQFVKVNYTGLEHKREETVRHRTYENHIAGEGISLYGAFAPRVLPRDLAELWQKILRRQFGGSLSIKLSPVSEAAGAEILREDLLRLDRARNANTTSTDVELRH